MMTMNKVYATKHTPPLRGGVYVCFICNITRMLYVCFLYAYALFAGRETTTRLSIWGRGILSKRVIALPPFTKAGTGIRPQVQWFCAKGIAELRRAW
jgi:hypothetical protein